MATLPPELWIQIFSHLAPDDLDLPLEDTNVADLGSASYLHAFDQPSVISSSRNLINLALVNHQWHDLSEPVRYRHLHASDHLSSLHQLHAALCHPASTSTRSSALSRADRNYRSRGVWARSLTIVSSQTLPLATANAVTFKINEALSGLFKQLPKLVMLVLKANVFDAVVLTSRRLFSAMPVSVERIAFTGVYNRARQQMGLLSSAQREQIRVLKIEGHATDNDLQPPTISLPNLRWLLSDANTGQPPTFNMPKLSYLGFAFRHNSRMDGMGERLEVLGTKIRRLSLIYIDPLQPLHIDCLQWCTQLHTLEMSLIAFFRNGIALGDVGVDRPQPVFKTIGTLVIVVDSKSWLRVKSQSSKECSLTRFVDDFLIETKTIKIAICRNVYTEDVSRIVASMVQPKRVMAILTEIIET